MGNIGATEIILILILALVVFGPRRLPEIGRTVGKSLREFRKASQDLRDEFQFSLDDDEPPMVTSPAQPQPVPVPEPEPKPRAKPKTKPPAAETGGEKPAVRAKPRTPAGGPTRTRSRKPKSGTTGTTTRSA
jgi:sec-independent protein translocase protein TatA